MSALRVWLPVIAGFSGTDVWTRRLAAGLARVGVQAEISWHHRLFELAPLLLAGVAPPAGTCIVHANSWNAFAFRRRGLALVTTDHQGTYAPGMRPLEGAARRFYYAQVVRRHVAQSCARADAVTAVSEAVAEALRRAVPAARAVRCLPNWMDTARFTPAPPAPRRAGPFRLLFVGTPTWAKGGDLLAPVMRALGEGFELRYTSGLKDRELPGRPPNSRCIGRLQGDHAIAAAYREADAFLFPTRAEGMSLVTLEAMACGLPVVTSDIPAQRELLGAGTGRLCPAGDVDAFVAACREIADDETLRRDLGAAARARVEQHFDERVVMPRYRSLYESLVERG